jgi:hypothetical protein
VTDGQSGVAGTWAAAATAHGDPIACAIAGTAACADSPLIQVVTTERGLGRTLRVSSVMIASCPQDPAISLDTS